MIPLDPKYLIREIDSAERLRTLHLKNMQTLVKRYVGNYFRTDWRGKPVPENMQFSYLATLLPQIIFDNPKVMVSADRAVAHKAVAQWMKYAINGWTKKVELRNELELVCIDMMFAFGLTMQTIEARGDFPGDPTRGVFERFQCQALLPTLMRIEPEFALLDATCKTLGQARLQGHEFWRDIDSLQSDDRYNQEVIGKLTPQREDEMATMDGQQKGGRAKSPRMVTADIDRKRVQLYQLFLPEHRMICTLVRDAGGESAFARDPRPYVGPDSGPYTWYGVYAVPSQPYPLSPLAAMAEQFQDLNAHAVAAGIEASSHKRFAVVDANSPGLKQAIVDVPSGGVVQFPGFNAQQAVQMELGGTSEGRLKYILLLRDRLDRVMGTSDAVRGNAQDVTATEANIADVHASNRTEFIQLKFRQAVKTALTKVGWIFFYDPAVVMAISYPDEATGQTMEGLFLGGIQPGQEGMDWPSFFLDIEPYSMRRMDPAFASQQAEDMLQLAVTIGPMIVQMPWINWRAILDDLGEANNVPDFTERILSPMGLQLIQSPPMQGMLTGNNPMAAMGMPPGVNPNLAAGMAGLPVKSLPMLPGPGAGSSSAPGGPPAFNGFRGSGRRAKATAA